MLATKINRLPTPQTNKTHEKAPGDRGFFAFPAPLRGALPLEKRYAAW